METPQIPALAGMTPLGLAPSAPTFSEEAIEALDATQARATTGDQQAEARRRNVNQEDQDAARRLTPEARAALEEILRRFGPGTAGGYNPDDPELAVRFESMWDVLSFLLEDEGELIAQDWQEA